MLKLSLNDFHLISEKFNSNYMDLNFVAISINFFQLSHLSLTGKYMQFPLSTHAGTIDQ